MKNHTCKTFPPTALAVALFAAFPAQAAESDDVDDLAKPGSTVSVGAGLVSHDNQRFGQYTGLREQGFYGSMNIGYVDRDDATGTWTKLTARNLGLPDREFSAELQRQGDWGIYLEDSHIPRYNPYVVNTRLSGIGTSSQTVNGLASAQDVQLKTVRDVLGIGFDKTLGSGFSLQLRFRNEDKDGARQFGQGSGNTMNFLTDPISQTTRQLEAILNYTGETFQLAGGYYSTEFVNNNNRIDVTGGIAGFTPIALPPANQSQQLYLAGGYTIDPVTRANFKLAHTHQTQNDPFMAATLTGRSGLGAEVDTTLAQVGITSRPLQKLSLNANLRYEDKKDRTPIVQYFTGVNATSTLDGTNEPRSITSTVGKAEASYALPMDFRLTGGYDWEVRKRNTLPVRSVSFRTETDEQSYRAELRRSVSETVTGALAYVHSDRDGSPFLTTTLNGGGVGSNLVAPLYLADRKRDKVRVSLNWQASEKLSVQFFADDARDKYNGDDVRTLGPMKGSARNYSVDAGYAVTDAWQATAWLSRNDNRAEQQTRVSGGQFWQAKLRNLGDAAGLGMRGKASARVEVGADLQASTIKDEYHLEALTGAPIASPTDVSTKLMTLKLFSSYAIDKSTTVRLDYIFDSWKTDDWTWANWVYSDGTRVIQSPTQKVHFLGASYQYRWR